MDGWLFRPWADDELSLAELTLAERQRAERLIRGLVRRGWNRWAAQAEVKRRLLALRLPHRPDER